MDAVERARHVDRALRVVAELLAQTERSRIEAKPFCDVRQAACRASDATKLELKLAQRLRPRRERGDKLRSGLGAVFAERLSALDHVFEQSLRRAQRALFHLTERLRQFDGTLGRQVESLFQSGRACRAEQAHLRARLSEVLANEECGATNGS